MPVYVIDGKHILFRHIPKCGGSTVEAALRPLGAELLYDKRFHGDADRFSACSAQHLHAGPLARLFPEEFFDVDFAVVRHPVDRAVSEFRFRRGLRPRSRRVTRPGRLGPEPEAFAPWVQYATDAWPRHPYLFDNHIRPQSEFLGPKTQVFRLEDGLDRVFTALEKVLGRAIAAPRRREQVSDPIPVEVTENTKARLAAFYARDFEVLGYDAA